jgi:two-component system, OmpR family, sensor kinase
MAVILQVPAESDAWSCCELAVRPASRRGLGVRSPDAQQSPKVGTHPAAMSLRSRLVATLLAISAAGLLLLGSVTYVEQRGFLLQRVDQQVRQAPPAVGRLLADAGIGAAPAADDHHDGTGGGGPSLPAGTYVELRSAGGTVEGSLLLGAGATSSAQLRLPSTVATGTIATASVAGHGTYRLTAMRGQDGTLTIVAVPLSEVQQTLQRLLLVEALVIAVVLALLALVARRLVRAGLRPLDRMGATAGAIAAGDLTRRVEDVDPRTETGRLGLALNGMLDRLERSFAEQQASEERLRRFLADASHELRTPLTSIRGYAELFRAGAVQAPADRERVMRRIEDESARMGVLVEDLLTLARLDEVAATPHAPLDLSALVADAVDDARAAAPTRAISAAFAGPALVLGHGDQLRQVLANLLRNAAAHTPDGTPIDVTVGHALGQATIVVRDHGPGLPPRGGDRLFERFWRAQDARGRERGPAGAGLGLAIVAAIVAAHGGTVRAEDAEGGGAQFVVTLPELDAPPPRPAPAALARA